MIHIVEEVRDALAEGRGVVALESTIFSPFGLPAPANLDALTQCLAVVRDAGAVPAVTAVLDGHARVGLDPAEHERILHGGRKVAARDLPVAIARDTPVGVTTVSASLALAHAAGISMFATGGIGGVHRGEHATGDISSDLTALASHPVVTVCAGAKAFLDLPRTLEYLETASVPVVGWQTDEFPMFWCRSSGLALSSRVDDAEQAARVFRAQRELTPTHGVLICVPIPPEAAISPEIVQAAIDGVEEGATGAAVTPRVLAAIADATGGRTVAANIVLAAHNASVAARIAEALVG
ncbi:MAG TPA: pseudouridine-5'-phosphate glycosidase [Acidimicrobiia bacterium]|nr:pseudouridine-5'-phosphate glycosidase [Acidimicrobiia bacterium]